MSSTTDVSFCCRDGGRAAAAAAAAAVGRDRLGIVFVDGTANDEGLVGPAIVVGCTLIE